MQLKARVNARAKEAGIPAQMMMQNYLLERLLERLSRSPWRDRVVVKGGMLISSLVGVASRTTMDLDTTVRGFELTHESAEVAFREIIAVEADDDWDFEFVRTEDIRETDDYPGVRVHLGSRSRKPAVPPRRLCRPSSDRNRAISCGGRRFQFFCIVSGGGCCEAEWREGIEAR